MKITAFFLSFYFVAMATFGSVVAIKTMLKSSCESTCCKNSCSDIPTGCNKDKCLLNLSFNTQNFIVETIAELTTQNFKQYSSKSIVNFYTENYISQNLKKIFHPPELVFTI